MACLCVYGMLQAIKNGRNMKKNELKDTFPLKNNYRPINKNDYRYSILWKPVNNVPVNEEKDNYLTNQWIQETISNIPKEFVSIYQNRIALMHDKNEAINPILLSALHAVTLQHNLIEKNISNIVKTKI